MNCEICFHTPPPKKCTEDCEECPSYSPDIPYPCCTCLQWEANIMEQGDQLEQWIKREVELYNRIVHEGPLDNYTPQGKKRLIQIFSIASRMSQKLIQKKTMIRTTDPALQEQLNHYINLYNTTIRYHTADNHDTLEDILVETQQILHQLMTFFNTHFRLNYNLQPKPQTKNGPSPDEQLDSIRKAVKNGEKATPC